MKLPSVTVSIPCYKTKGLLRKVVKLVLRQDYSQFEVLVICDNDPGLTDEIRDFKDPRLKVIDLEKNIGRYAIDHLVVTELSNSEYWIPVDSDDWCSPKYISNLVKLANKTNPDVVFSAQKVYTHGRSRLHRVKQWDGTDRLQWLAHMSALWKRAYLLEMNLTNPNFRVGWDSIVTSVPWLTGKIEVNQNPLYHRVRRNNSLTGSKETGFKSEYRERVKTYLIKLWADLVKYKEDVDMIKQLLLRSRHAQY